MIISSKTLKGYIMLTFALTILTFLGCSTKPLTIEEKVQKVLSKRKIAVEKLYYAEEIEGFNNIAVAFYKDKDNSHDYIGLFYKNDNSWNFYISEDLQSHQENWSNNSNLTYGAIFSRKRVMPEFSFSFGIIKNPLIEKVNLNMLSGEIKNRQPKILDINGLRIYYTIISDSVKIFNVQQGLSKEGKVIYDSFYDR